MAPLLRYLCVATALLGWLPAGVARGVELPELFLVRGGDQGEMVQMELEPVPTQPSRPRPRSLAVPECIECEGMHRESCDNCGPEHPHQEPHCESVLSNFGHSLRSQLGEAYWGAKAPLTGTSWMNRPLHVDGFLGVMIGDDLIAGRVGQTSGMFGGVRFGWDTDPYWGLEGRIGVATVDLEYQTRSDSEAVGDLTLADVSLMYYPFGDARWRPYFGVGLGMLNIYAQDEAYDMHDETLLAVPIGIGVKYYHRNWLALRLDLTDNIAIGSGDISTMNNLSLTAGFEYRFGGSRPSYWPWNPGSYVR